MKITSSLEMKRHALEKLRAEAKDRIVSKMFPKASGHKDEGGSAPAKALEIKPPEHATKDEGHPASLDAAMGADGEFDGALGMDPEKVTDEDKKAKLVHKLLAALGGE